MEDYGIKVAKDNESALTKDRKNMHYTSGAATYLRVKKITVSKNANPYVVIHNLGYIPKVIVNHVLSDHNRRLPYKDTDVTALDFSITKNEVKLRGSTNGTFVIHIFAQPIL